MTTRMVRHMAREIAGAYYDDPTRTTRFRIENPNQDIYVNKMWPHFTDLAVRALAAMLTLPGYPEHLKETITDELIEQNRRAHSPGARYVAQADLIPHEKEDRKLIDDNPQLITSG